MASRRRSSATTARPVKKSPSKVIIQEKVTKYTKPLEIKKVTEEKPTKVRPEKTNLSMKDYMDDFQVRMQIHNFEVDELLKDLRNSYDFVLPYVLKAGDWTLLKYSQIQRYLETQKDQPVKTL